MKAIVILGVLLVMTTIQKSSAGTDTQNVTELTALRKHGTPPSCKGLERTCKHVANVKKITNFDINNDCLVPLIDGKPTLDIDAPAKVITGCKNAVDALVELDMAHSHTHSQPH